MPFPLAIPLIMGGLSAATAIGSNLFRPKQPKAQLLDDQDFVNPVRNQFELAARELQEQQRYVYEQDLMNQRASGITGSGAVGRMRNIFDSNNDARTKLNSYAADRIAQAIAQQNMMNKQIQYQNDTNRYNDLMGRFNGVVGGISNMFDTFGSIASMGGMGGAPLVSPEFTASNNSFNAFVDDLYMPKFNNPFLPS